MNLQHSGSEQSAREYARRINMAIDYIENNLAEPLDLESVATAASFSKYHFHRIFQAVMQETVAEFTRRIRLERALHSLQFNRSQSITDIAMKCGFSSSQNFAKIFRKRFGITPSEWRKQNHPLQAWQKSNPGNISHNNGNDDFISLPHIKNIHSFTTRRDFMNVVVKDLPPLHVAYLRRLGPYGPEIGPLFQRVLSWAGSKGLLNEHSAVLSAYWDNPEVTDPSKCRSDACVSVPQGTTTDTDIAVQTLPGGQYAVYHATLKTEEFMDAWESMYTKWLPTSGYQPDDMPCYEFCYSTPEQVAQEIWVVDICVPVKPL